MDELKNSIERIYEKYIAKCLQHKAESFSGLSEISVTDSHYLEILYYLDDPTFSQFADAANVSKPAATQIIKKFIAKGYLSKVQSQTDKRVYRLQLHDGYKQYFAEISRVEAELFKSVVSALTEDEITFLTKTLHKIESKL
ncbi:MarR family winged helix-turn-helix transcriptional regulator [Halodesulfovibrio spirochaetisodalis]|uniref:HTH marR-type domain-containing protein n=1 Tax=Halodesulfovibrio spirochaetisodalis TaxID=1560234 RepID=A0A1B7XCC9_9BACT|nr:MarR family transcriptional regulator [Halodesulfovibrio spirochaetisodalis]OBQ51568.1 hypothetical protein SP90_09295 [Halodesulfovibrio spirochaetisodalis]